MRTDCQNNCIKEVKSNEHVHVDCCGLLANTSENRKIHFKELSLQHFQVEGKDPDGNIQESSNQSKNIKDCEDKALAVALDLNPQSKEFVAPPGSFKKNESRLIYDEFRGGEILSAFHLCEQKPKKKKKYRPKLLIISRPITHVVTYPTYLKPKEVR